MANDTILTPGGEHWSEPEQNLTSLEYLEKDNYLSEFETDGEKAIARENLGVYDRNSVYTKLETDTKLNEALKKAFEKYLDEGDPHGILPKVELLIKDFVKNDGTTPFTAPLEGVDPVKDLHLTTKRFVTKLLDNHVGSYDPHLIIPKVESILGQYVKLSQVYLKDQVYTKTEVDKLNKLYIRKDGTTPFTKALIGVDPQIDSHLSTKRYVDLVMLNHKIEIDPHNFISILNNRLANYAKAANVYDKTLTYSRVQIDSLINKLVKSAADEALLDYINQYDPHNILDKIKKEGYVNKDGSVPFIAPQKGVDAVDPDDLVTLQQLLEKECIWITSGPVESTVGHVEDNTLLPDRMTMQEILDAIFYGKQLTIDVDPDHVGIGKTTQVTVCIHGSLALIDYAELYLDGKLIYTFQPEDFEDGCVTVESDPIYEDAEFEFKVYYSNGSPNSVTATVTCVMPIFVGLLPKWKFANYINYEYLQELENEDIEGTLNRFIELEGELSSITFEYKFKDPKLRHPFVVVPESYPDLEEMVTKSLRFGIEAFDVIDRIPFLIPGLEKDVIYKIYVYRLALSSLNQEVTFNFAKE